MVAKVKQSEYTTKNDIRRRDCTIAPTLVLLQPIDILMDPLFIFYAKIIFQNHSYSLQYH